MSIEALVGISLGIAGSIGVFIAWFVSWLKGLIRAEIAAYDIIVKDKRIHDLEEDNRRLREWAEKSK